MQAYNFGPAYIDYIAQNGKENTLALAKQYSRDTVAPLLGNTTGKTYSYIHPISIFHGAELYVMGGTITILDRCNSTFTSSNVSLSFQHLASPGVFVISFL